MPTIKITVSQAVAQDFNEMARERGCADGRAYIIDWAKGELARWY